MSEHQMWRFLNPAINTYGDVGVKNTNWNTDIHLLSTYIFLDNQEREVFANNTQKYLIKDVYNWDIPNVVGSSMVDIDSRGLVASYMFRLRRNDVNLRNAWSNYTNWPYNSPPYSITPAASDH